MRRSLLTGVLGLVGVLFTSLAHAANYDEASSGDLSTVNTAPTSIALSSGANVVSGTTATVQGVTDRDYFKVTVPAGFQLATINLNSYTGTSVSFMGVERGAVFTDPSTTVQAQLLGYLHFGSAHVGTNVLDDIGVGAGAQGFTGALQAGDYSFWVQETGSAAVNYSFTLQLVALPPPVPALPVGFGVLLVGALLMVGASRMIGTDATG